LSARNKSELYQGQVSVDNSFPAPFLTDSSLFFEPPLPGPSFPDPLASFLLCFLLNVSLKLFQRFLQVSTENKNVFLIKVYTRNRSYVTDHEDVCFMSPGGGRQIPTKYYYV